MGQTQLKTAGLTSISNAKQNVRHTPKINVGIKMQFIVKNIKPIMLLSGVLTCSMVYAVFAPEVAVTNTFGEPITGPVANIVVRSWGALVTLMGIMLIFGAFNPPNRKFAAAIAAISKFIWVGLIFFLGGKFLGTAGVVVGFDAAVAVILSIYVLTPTRNSNHSNQAESS
jgi:hypothetical protein